MADYSFDIANRFSTYKAKTDFDPTVNRGEEQERLEKQVEEKMERWVYLTDLDEQIRAEGRDGA